MMRRNAIQCRLSRKQYPKQDTNMIHRCTFLCLFATLVAGQTAPAAEKAAEIVAVKKIWDEAPHNAFTDLVRFRGQWFCVFREGKAHVSPDGALRVLTSPDGEGWTSAALITSKDSDLRDAKITVTPDGTLMLCGAGAMHPPSDIRHQSLAWFSPDGRAWSEPAKIGDPDFWLWRVTWHKKIAYGIGYATTEKKMVRLYKSDNGREFQTLVENLFEEGYPNETSLLFLKDDTCLCLLRRDGKPNDALLGKSKPPYTEWTWESLGIRVGGPHLLQLPDGRLVAAGRDYAGGAKTRLWWLDPAKPALTEIVTLPSGGDTSYPGLVWHDGLLWVSYYASHEGKTSIFLARVKLPPAE
jgi:hypothetical protein